MLRQRCRSGAALAAPRFASGDEHAAEPVRHHWPLTHEPTLWSVVFPLGMYSVATLAFGKAAHLAFMAPLSRFMFWVAVAAWALVAAAFLVRLTHPPARRG
jgi:tellurite resistance protein TehA-like permease